MKLKQFIIELLLNRALEFALTLLSELLNRQTKKHQYT